MQNTQNYGFHGIEFLRGYLEQQKKHKYLATPKPDDYLTLRQRGSLDGLTESLHRLNNYPTSNTSQKTGTYPIATKLGLYNPATSFTLNAYAPNRSSYQKEKDQYHPEKNKYSV